MALPEFTRQLVDSTLSAYCDQRVPLHVRDRVQVGYTIKGNAVTLFERRPDFRNKNEWIQSPIARFRYNQTSSEWTLFHADRNSKWHEYPRLGPCKDFSVLLSEVDSDPTAIFWG